VGVRLIQAGHRVGGLGRGIRLGWRWWWLGAMGSCGGGWRAVWRWRRRCRRWPGRPRRSRRVVGVLRLWGWI